MRQTLCVAGALVAGSLSAALLVSSPALAQDGLGAGLLSILGFSVPDAPGIEYRERAPLVVPPRSSLPSPQEREASRARANWPNDPNAERRRRGDAGESEAWADRRRFNGNNTRLSNDELARGRNGVVSTTPYGGEDRDLLYGPMRQMQEADARYAARAQRDAAERPLGAEPPRKYLVEPPPGYRAPTQRVARTTAAPNLAGDRDVGVRDFLAQEARR